MASVGGGGASSDLTPYSSSDPRGRLWWGKLSRLINVIIVGSVLYAATWNFLNASPHFAARFNDLLNSHAFHRLSSVRMMPSISLL